MNYKIKVYKTKSNEWSTKAYASVTFNNSFVVTGITVREGTKKESQYTRIIAIQSQRSSETNFMATLLMPIPITGRKLK